jgi:hypothetical protein
MMGYCVDTGKMAAIMGVVLLAACQRPAADVSAVPYKVIDERAGGADCVVCVVSAPRAPCMDDKAAEVHWTLPAASEVKQVTVQIRRQGGPREDVAVGAGKGQVALAQPVHPGDRIIIRDADSNRDLYYVRVNQLQGCTPRGRSLPSVGQSRGGDHFGGAGILLQPLH